MIQGNTSDTYHMIPEQWSAGKSLLVTGSSRLHVDYITRLHEDTAGDTKQYEESNEPEWQ